MYGKNVASPKIKPSHRFDINLLTAVNLFSLLMFSILFFGEDILITVPIIGSQIRNMSPVQSFL